MDNVSPIKDLIFKLMTTESKFETREKQIWDWDLTDTELRESLTLKGRTIGSNSWDINPEVFWAILVLYCVYEDTDTHKRPISDPCPKPHSSRFLF